MRTRVFIPTTEGPVAVDRIIRSPLGKSIVCERGGKEPLRAFSAKYNEFVRKRIAQPGQANSAAAFRLDVSGRIDTGDSWQLAVFLAHALQDADRLARPEHEEQAGSILVASGEIEYGLTVGAVGYIEEKLRAAYSLIEAGIKSGQRVLVALPAGNATDGRAEQECARRLGVELISVGSVQEVFKRLDLSPPAWTPSDEEPWEGTPFRGLSVFEQHHRRIFFGRGKAREEALRQLRRQAQEGCAFLLIHGSSGAGKSSLARAGLLGDIQHMATVTEPWRSAVLVPSRGGLPAIPALAEALLDALPGISLDRQGLAARIADSPTEAVGSITAALACARPGGRTKLVLLVDQLEELLLWARERGDAAAEAQREAFAEILGLLARTGVVWVIATLRSDLLNLLDDSPTLSQLARSDRLYRLERPSRAALHEIVKRPAELAGFQFTGRDAEGLQLADVLVEAGAASPDSLPLLQFALERLFEKEGRAGTISYDTYKDIGELTNAIGEWAEATVLELGTDPGTARAVDDLILELGRPDSESGTIVGRTAVLDSGFVTPAREQAIEALARARLLVLDTIGGHRTCRVAHEALLSNWPRAQTLFASRKLALELRERLNREAAEWLAEGRDPASLIRSGPRLATAEQLLAEGLLHFTEEVRAFVAASIAKDQQDKAEERRRQEEALEERRRRGERERLRLATDQQKIEGHLRAREYQRAATVLSEVLGYLEQPDSELAGERRCHRDLHERVGRLARFFAGMQETFALAGEEDFRAAHAACERALGALDVLDDPRWWERLPAADLGAAHIAHVKQEVYRLLLLYSGLQLIPAIQIMLAKPPEEPPPRVITFNGTRLVRYLPEFVLSAVVSAGGIGPVRLPRRQDKPEALAELAKSADALLRARQLGEVLGATGEARSSRTSYLVGEIVAMLTELASAPKGAPIDYKAWLGPRAQHQRPEPVNAADYFYVGLFNYFVAMRRDAMLATFIKLLRGRFPDLDGRSPFRTAERLLRASIALEPHNYWPHWVLGRTLLVSGDHRGAELAFNGAIAVQPNYARGYEQRALALAHQWVRSGEPSLRARAEADSAMALAVADGDPSVYWPRGELLELLGCIREAVHAYSRWLELEENVLAKISRGTGIVHLGKLATRLLHRPAAFKANDDRALRADAHGLLALVQLTRAEDAEAARQAEAALVIDPRHGHALTVKGVLLLRLSEPKRAVDILGRALENDPHNHLAALSYARACERLGADAMAQEAWRALEAAGAPGVAQRCPQWMLREAELARKRLAPFIAADPRRGHAEPHAAEGAGDGARAY
jgi:tetratricopeptide (TPR) repeat protein